MSGWDCAGTLVIHDNDAFRGDCAFRHLECRRDRALGKQSFSTAQRYRKYLQPEGIHQIMLHERLNKICASINVQIRPFLLLNFGDCFRNISVLETPSAAIREKSRYSRRRTWCCVDGRPHVIMLRPESCPNVKGFAPQQQVKRQVHLIFYGRSTNRVGMWTHPPAICEAGAAIFLWPAWGLYDTIKRDKFKHVDFSHDWEFLHRRGG